MKRKNKKMLVSTCYVSYCFLLSNGKKNVKLNTFFSKKKKKAVTGFTISEIVTIFQQLFLLYKKRTSHKHNNKNIYKMIFDTKI